MAAKVRTTVYFSSAQLAHMKEESELLSETRNTYISNLVNADIMAKRKAKKVKK